MLLKKQEALKEKENQNWDKKLGRPKGTLKKRERKDYGSKLVQEHYKDSA